MVRLVPTPPRLTFIHRHLARLPAGISTGIACGTAGVACVLGLLVIGPSVLSVVPFHDDHTLVVHVTRIASILTPIAADAKSEPGSTAKPDKATTHVAIAVVARSTGGGSGQTTADNGTPAPTPAPAARPTETPTTQQVAPRTVPTSTPRPSPSARPHRTAEPRRTAAPREDDSGDHREASSDDRHRSSPTPAPTRSPSDDDDRQPGG